MTACGYSLVANIEADDVVGVWQENSHSCENGFSDCAWIELSENGQFEVNNLQSDYFGYWPDHPNFTFHATGQWEIETPYPSEKYSLIRLHLDEESLKYLLNENTVINIESNRKGDIRLFAWYSDPMNRITFIRQSTDEEK
jgi:hypothetical protein